MAADESPAAIDLSREPDFEVGPLAVHPSKREVVNRGERETLEPRVMQVLVALAGRRGEVVSRDDLIAACWEGRIVGDDAISGAVAKVRRLGEANGAFSIETIPRVGYRLLEAVAARPSAPAPKRRTPAWRWAAVALVLLVVAAGIAFAWQMRRPASSVSVAVQPFSADPPGQEGAATASRVHDQIVGVLTARQMEVAASPHKARQAQLVVGGTVEPVGEAVRIRAHIDDARSGTVLWQREFEGSNAPDSPLAEQVAAKVSDLVDGGVIIIRSSHGMISSSALKAWMQGLDNQRDGNALEMREFFRAFRDSAPNLGAAQAAFAIATITAGGSQPPETQKVWRAEATAAAQRAIALDPHYYGGYFALASLKSPKDFAGRLETGRRGLRVVPPEGSLETQFGINLIGVGRPQEGLTYIRRGLVLNPLSPPKNYGMVHVLAADGLTDEARALLARSERLWPDFKSRKAEALRFAVGYASPEEAKPLLLNLRTTTGPSRELDFWSAYFESLACDCRKAPVAETIAAEAQAGRLELGAALMALTRLGEKNLAFDVALATPPKSNFDLIVLFSVLNAPMRRQPRFMDLAAEMGLADYWLKSGQWPEFCAEPGLPYNCKAEAARAQAALKAP